MVPASPSGLVALTTPSTVSSPSHPVGRRQEADREVGSRAGEVKRVEVRIVEARRFSQLRGAPPPRLDRIGLVHPADVHHLLPQPLERRA
jgi:hypothetical protein